MAKAFRFKGRRQLGKGERLSPGEGLRTHPLHHLLQPEAANEAAGLPSICGSRRSGAAEAGRRHRIPCTTASPESTLQPVGSGLQLGHVHFNLPRSFKDLCSVPL